MLESLSAQISLKFEKIDLMKNSHRRREIEKNKIYIITQVEILISAPNISEYCYTRYVLSTFRVK